MIESLEARVLFSVKGTSSVALYDANGSPASIQAGKRLWFIFHGLDGSHDDMTPMAAGVQAQDPTSQVLVVDWSYLADPTVASTVRTQLDNAWAVADWVALRLRRARVPASRVNLIGFSMGGQAEDRLAADLNGGSKSQVNRIIAIDPADPHVNGRARQLPHFADESAYSIGFTGVDTAAFYAGALSCDDVIQLTGLPADDMVRHVSTAEVMGTMFRRSGGLDGTADGVSNIFSIQNILVGHLPGWRHGQYGYGFEAQVSCAATGNDWPLQYGPVVLAYVNGRGHTVHH